MIEKMAIRIIDIMEKDKLLSSSEREHHIYALITMVERWITLTTILVLSILWRNLISTVLFLTFFFSLRNRTGGYHAKKFWQCYIGTVLTYIAVVFINPIWNNHIELLVGMVVVSVISILKVGTVNHPNMNLEVEEIIEMEKATKYLLALQCIAIVLGIVFRLDISYVGFMADAIILCALLQFVAKIIKQEIR